MASAAKVGPNHNNHIIRKFPEVPDVIDEFGRICCLVCFYRDKKYIPLNSYNNGRDCSCHQFDALEKLLIKKGLVNKKVKGNSEIKIYLNIPELVNTKLNKLCEMMKKNKPMLIRQEVIVQAIEDYLKNPERSFEFNFEDEKKTNFHLFLPMELNAKLLSISENGRRKRADNVCSKNRHIILALIRLLNCHDLTGV